MKHKSKMIFTAACMGAFSVALGAFGAHALKSQISIEALEIYKTGIYYFQFHVLAMLGYALWWPGSAVNIRPFYGFIFGAILFTGSLIALSLTGFRMLGAITPLGGVLWISSWIGFALQAKKQQ
jgi:uncharacterized membrane protein YgdD (TMEM256/DUF423 family)